MSDIKRWYDKDPRMAQILAILEHMPDETKEEFASVLIKLINIIKKNKTNDLGLTSLGKNRVLGLYKAFRKRRWYDHTPGLMYALNVLSTLDLVDFNTVVDGILITLTESNE